MNAIINHLIEELENIQHGSPWVGSTYQRKLKSIDSDLVFKRPMDDMHSIAEIISHLTLWRKEAILKIKTGKGSKTDDCEENWLPNTILERQGWASIKEAYDHSLSELIALLHQENDSFLTKEYYDTDFKGTYPYRFLLNGMLQHDLYHLGQLGLIIKYLKKSY
ncbi:DinB family protein [Dokdonia ponticola]|uniref:DinB family protein n=1 Tax=Dokdonia ponticola TaxID=2041041 RepID=A0ABV9HS44_9FLAO